MREPLDLLAEAITVERLDGLDDTGVKLAAAVRVNRRYLGVARHCLHCPSTGIGPERMRPSLALQMECRLGLALAIGSRDLGAVRDIPGADPLDYRRKLISQGPPTLNSHPTPEPLLLAALQRAVCAAARRAVSSMRLLARCQPSSRS